MPNNFSYTDNVISSEDISFVEKQIGISLPDEVVNHYLSNNGGIPTKTYWVKDNWVYLWLHEFLPIKYTNETTRTLEETYLFLRNKNLIPENLVPFAVDHGGNYFCFDSEGKIYFYTMDDWNSDFSYEENQEQSKQYLCKNINEFIDGLLEEPE